VHEFAMTLCLMLNSLQPGVQALLREMVDPWDSPFILIEAKSIGYEALPKKLQMKSDDYFPCA
jgi:hypothetical protein